MSSSHMKLNLPAVGDINIDANILKQIISLMTTVLLAIAGGTSLDTAQLKNMVPDNALAAVKSIGADVLKEQGLGDAVPFVDRILSADPGTAELPLALEDSANAATRSITDSAPQTEKPRTVAPVAEQPHDNVPASETFMVANFPQAPAADEEVPVVFSFVEKKDGKVTPFEKGTWSGTINGRDVNSYKAKTNRELAEGILALKMKPSEMKDIDVQFESQSTATLGAKSARFHKDSIQLDTAGQTTLFSGK